MKIYWAISPHLNANVAIVINRKCVNYICKSTLPHFWPLTFLLYYSYVQMVKSWLRYIPLRYHMQGYKSLALKSILALSTNAKSSSDLATKVLCTELSAADRIWYEKCKKPWCVAWESPPEWSVKCLWLHIEMLNVWPYLVQIDADGW